MLFRWSVFMEEVMPTQEYRRTVIRTSLNHGDERANLKLELPEWGTNPFSDAWLQLASYLWRHCYLLRHHVQTKIHLLMYWSLSGLMNSFDIWYFKKLLLGKISKLETNELFSFSSHENVYFFVCFSVCVCPMSSVIICHHWVVSMEHIWSEHKGLFSSMCIWRF